MRPPTPDRSSGRVYFVLMVVGAALSAIAIYRALF